MPRKKSITKPISKWLKTFQNEAKADGLAILDEHIARLEIREPGAAEALMKGTQSFVVACLTYAQLDNRPFDDFLAHQNYDPAAAPTSTYAVTFEIIGKAYGRLLVDDLHFIDFSDMFEHVWYEYESCGYTHIFISRNDGTELSEDELMQLEQEITEDLHFDYAEDDLDIMFDAYSIEGVLTVSVQERYGEMSGVETEALPWV